LIHETFSVETYQNADDLLKHGTLENFSK
jgi:hypothetical protein